MTDVDMKSAGAIPKFFLSAIYALPSAHELKIENTGNVMMRLKDEYALRRCARLSA